MEPLLETRKAEPKYIVIRDALRREILDGRYAPTDRIPTEQELTGLFGVSRITVRRAVDFLEKDGFVSRRQGSGTFVNKLRDNGNPCPEITHLVYLLVDTFYKEHAPMWTPIHRAARWLSERDISLSIVPITSEEIASGRIPAVLQSGNVQGLLMDGGLQNFHRQLPERLGLPYLFIGNRPLDRSIPQVRFDHQSSVREAVQLLYGLVEQPVALLSDNLLYYGREILGAYGEEIKHHAQRGPLFQPCLNQDSFGAVETLLSYGIRHFSVITMGALVHDILRAYAKHGISPSDNPIVVFDIEESMKMKDRPHVYLASLGDLLSTALRVFLKAYQDDDWEIHVDLTIPITPLTQD